MQVIDEVLERNASSTKAWRAAHNGGGGVARLATGVSYGHESGTVARGVAALPKDEQDAIASQILASLADEDAWKKRFAEKRDVIRRIAREALEEDERGETLPLHDLL